MAVTDMDMDTVITADNRRCRFKTFSGRSNSMKEQEKYCIVNGVKYYVDEKKAYSVVKRVFDVAASLTALILFFWVFAIIALVIKLNDGGPVFYVSKRVGRFGKEFDFYKFRSMHVNAEEMLGDLLSQNETSGQLFKMKNDPRITRVGMFLRKTSLDELPQLFNILKGDMSFVGPRPPLVREVENYTEYSMQRLSVIGGLTCYWQISGSSSICSISASAACLRILRSCSRRFLPSLRATARIEKNMMIKGAVTVLCACSFFCVQYRETYFSSGGCTGKKHET